MTTSVETYLQDDIVSFAFARIETYINANGEVKKKPINMPSWRQINKDNCILHSNGSALAVRTGQMSGITVFDFDNLDTYNNLIEKHPELKECKTIQTKKGFHIWFKYNEFYKTTTDAFTSEYPGVDIRNDEGLVFAPPTKYLLPDKTEVSYKDLGGVFNEVPEYFKDYIKTREQKIKQSKIQNVVQPELEVKLNDTIGKLLYCGMLDGQAYGSWDDWRNVALCMRYNTTFEHFDTFSKINDSKYDKQETLSMWDSIKENYETMNVGTLMKYAKEYNPDKYNLYFNYFLSLDRASKGSLKIAEVIAPKLERHLKWSNEQWFMFYPKTNLWMITKEPSHCVVNMIHKHLDYSIKMKMNERSNLDEDDEAGQKRIKEELEQYFKLYKQVDGSGFYSMITKHLKTILYDEDFYKLLDSNKYELAFKNGIFDLRTKTFKKGFNDYNYITKTIPFDYEEATNEDINFVMKEVLFKICNANDSHVKYLLDVLGQAMTGDAELEKVMYFMVGVGGNNGKTLLLDTLYEIMPNYVAKIDRKTFEKGYSKAHKHLVNLIGTRIAFIEEMDNKPQDINLMKDIADGKSIKNEVMYGTDSYINIMCKLFFLANCSANLRIDGGIENRYRQLCHNSRFEPYHTEDNFETLKFKQNKQLAELLRTKYKHAIIHLLIEHAYQYTIHKNIDIPEEFKEASKDVLEMNDETKTWFQDNCEYGDDFKCTKAELEQALSKPFREIQTEIQRITNLKYDRGLKHNKNRGGFKGFRIKPDCLVDV